MEGFNLKLRKLFTPIKIGKTWIKNRVALAPMLIMHQALLDSDGSYKQRAIDYYEERAKGGTGLIITSCTHIESTIEPIMKYGLEPLIAPSGLTALRELSEAIHYQGAKIFIQLTAGFGRVISYVQSGLKPVSASVNPSHFMPNVMTRALEIEEIQRLVKGFGTAAEMVSIAGIDGIELHAHEGYLFDQFTTSIWNRRTDKYGGTLENKLRFPIEVLQEIKDKVGKTFPVTYRFGLKHYLKDFWTGAINRSGYQEAGRDIPEGLEMAKLLEKAGFDALHVDAGCYESWYWPHPPTYQPHGLMVDMAAETKKVVSIPVIAVGRLDLPELAERTLDEGKADIIAIGRGLLADPYWVRKAQTGKLEDIRPCTGCHDGCLYKTVYEANSLCCTVNPAVGRERLYELKPAQDPKRIVIIGGGVAGMEAARVSAIRNHDVTLYERNETLGGHLKEASVPDFKQDIKRLLDWYKTQLEKLKVEIKLQKNATFKLVKEEKPDAAIIATGSVPIIPNVPGIDKPMVMTCIDLLLGNKGGGDSVVVVGGGLVGCETALWLAEQDKKLTIVEMLPELMWTPAGIPTIISSNRSMLLQLLAQNKVDILTNTTLKEVTDEGVVVVDKHSRSKAINCNTVALAIGLRSDKELYEFLIPEIPEIYPIGDCKEPRKILNAIWEGYNVARTI